MVHEAVIIIGVSIMRVFHILPIIQFIFIAWTHVTSGQAVENILRKDQTSTRFEPNQISRDSSDIALDMLLGLGGSVYEDYLTKLQKMEFLYISADMNTNTFWAGRELTESMSNHSLQAYYIHPSGLMTGMATIFFSKLDPQWNSSMMTIGYSGKLGSKSKLRFQTSFQKFLFHASEADPLFTNGISSGLSTRTSGINARLGGNFMFGRETSKQFSITLSKPVKLLKRSQKVDIQITPAINWLFSDDELVEYDDDLEEIFYSSFGMVNHQLRLPISIEIGSFDFEASYYYNIPNSLFEEDLQTTHFFGFSIGYLIGL